MTNRYVRASMDDAASIGQNRCPNDDGSHCARPRAAHHAIRTIFNVAKRPSDDSAFRYMPLVWFCLNDASCCQDSACANSSFRCVLYVLRGFGECAAHFEM